MPRVEDVPEAHDVERKALFVKPDQLVEHEPALQNRKISFNVVMLFGRRISTARNRQIRIAREQVDGSAEYRRGSQAGQRLRAKHSLGHIG